MKIKGLDELNKFIKRSSKLLDTSEYYAKASMVMLQDVKKNFLRKKNADGSSWARLKFRTGQPLRDKSRLFNSLTNAYDSKSAVTGTNNKGAAVHNYGYKFKPTKKQRGFFLYSSLLKNVAFASIVKIPQRQFMFLSKDGGNSLEKMTVIELEKL
jgi:phage gpG-like protein